MQSNFEKAKKLLCWLLFTNRCKYCNTLINYGEELCGSCRDNLPVIDGERCKYCGAEKERCNCRKHKKEYDGITAPFYYEDSIALAVRRMKFYGKTFLADALAECGIGVAGEDLKFFSVRNHDAITSLYFLLLCFSCCLLWLFYSYMLIISRLFQNLKIRICSFY